MNRLLLLPVFCLFVGLNIATAQELRTAESLSEAIEKGQAFLALRYRFEHVDQAGFDKNARASTLRSRLGLQTAQYMGFNAYVEAEDVQTIGGTLYNDTINGKTDYPVVADPDGTEVNQLYLAYKLDQQIDIKGGRRLLVLDDARFIGDVDWRQNSQTFDGADFNYSPIDNLKFSYGWIYQVNRVFGEDSEQGKFNSQNHLFNIKSTALENNTITLFSYLLDLDNADNLSAANYGVRWDGKTGLADQLNLLYEASFAQQQDYADNTIDYTANYYRVVPGINFENLNFKLGWEVLESDAGVAAFQTPLATLHKFNGWADQFTSTPVDGLDDRFVQVDYNFKNLLGTNDSILTARYHDFRSERGSIDYGSEWDFSWLHKFADRYFVEAKYANFDSEKHSKDTEKFWLSLGARFQT